MRIREGARQLGIEPSIAVNGTALRASDKTNFFNAIRDYNIDNDTYDKGGRGRGRRGGTRGT